MRIGINALYLIPGGVGGTETYLQELLRWMPRLARHHAFFTILNRESEDAAWATSDCLTSVGTRVQANNRPARLLYEQFRLPALASRLQLDVLFNPGFTAPAFAPCPTVTTFHDLQHKRHPEYFRTFDLPAWNLFLGIAARRSTRIVTVSEAGAKDFRRFYPRCTQPIDITPLGAREEFFALGESDRPDAGFLLCVSTLHPHKNHERLVRAFARWRATYGSRARLVLAGMRGFAAAEVERAIGECNASEFVTITGWLAHEQLLDLYRDARAFVFPSLFEGFGIPVVEAMACGLPVAVSGMEPMRSIAGEAALHFDPCDEEALVRAIDTVMSDEAARTRLRAAGRERACEFTWERTARLTLESIEAAARAVR